MLKRLAKKLCEEGVGCSGENLCGRTGECYVCEGFARDALEELRDPTEAMKLAAQKCELGGEDFAADHLEIYQAMLDEALS